jgi:hypothetical protein
MGRHFSILLEHLIAAEERVGGAVVAQFCRTLQLGNHPLSEYFASSTPTDRRSVTRIRRRVCLERFQAGAR